jgi:4-carboxymuconolactone decarboxylase
MNSKQKRLILIASISIFLVLIGCATTNPQPPTAWTSGGSHWQPIEQTERTRRAQATHQEIFGDMELSLYAANPEFADIINNFLYGDIYHQSGKLDLKLRGLITLAALTANQSWELLKLNVQGALNVGLTPIEIMEAIHQCVPYIGVARVYDGILAVNEVFQKNNITLPLESQRQVNDDERLAEGRRHQTEMYGLAHSDSSAPDRHIMPFLSEYCFGDFYTRSGLDLKTRQLLTFVILCNLGAESQMRFHIRGCAMLGWEKDEIIAAVTQCMSFMGMPRTLNAIAAVNEILPN